MKKIICFILSTLTILSIVNVDILRINSSAEDNTSEYATVKVITNNIPKKIVEGAQTGADIKTKKESKTTLIKKDNKIYMSLNDICEFTRTHKEKADNKYILKQGLQEITVIIEDNGNSKLKSLYGDFNIQTVTENNKVYCEPEPIMSMLFAECTYYDNTLLIGLPQYTVYEATSFDYSKYQSDILSYGIDENTDNMGTAFAKWGLSVQRMYVSFLSDIIVDANYGYFATDNTIRQYYYEAFNEVLGYDIYSNKSVIEEETKIYEKINDLGSFLEKTQGGDISDTPFTDFYISSYIDSYAKKGLKDNNSLSVFNDTIRDLSTNGRVNEKLNSYLNQSGKDVLTNILFNSALEYVKRSSYDRKVLEMFKTLYSEDTVNKYNISLSENGQFLFQCARDYYDSCGSFDDIVKEVTIDESINKFSEMIIKGLFSITTAGKSQEVFETYETILTAEKLQEANSSFKPIEKINNSAKYFWLAKMQYTTVLTFDNINKKAGESLNSEDMANYVSNLDFYNRVSAVMIKTLTDSYQLPTTTQREKDLVAHSDTYISDLCRNIYKLECCEYNLPTKEELNNKNCNVFKNFFSNQEFESTENYNWHLLPTIEAEDIIVSDDSFDVKKIDSDKKKSNTYSFIERDGKYNFITYDGDIVLEKWYLEPRIAECGELGVYIEASINKENDLGVMINISTEEYDGGWVNERRGMAEAVYYVYPYDKKTSKIYHDIAIGTFPHWGYECSNNCDNNSAILIQEANVIDNQNYGSNVDYNGKYGCAYNNEVTISPIYDNGIMNVYNDMIALKSNDKWGYFNGRTGEQVIDFIANEFNSKYYNKSGKENRNRYREYRPYTYSDGYVAINSDKDWALYDEKGNIIINYGTFEEVRPVHNGLAWVKKDGKWGVIKLVEITEPATTPTESNITAVDLIDKTLPEIISLMNGEYQIIKTENDGYIYIQNKSVLSGMEFYIQVSGDDIISANNGEEIHNDTLKAKLESGELTLDGIQVNKSGKVSETIQADMDYKSCSKVLGDFNCIGGTGGYLGGDVSSLSYYYNDKNAKVILNFNIPEEIYKDLILGKISSVSSEEMKSYNPNLRNVVIRKVETVTTMQTEAKENLIELVPSGKISCYGEHRGAITNNGDLYLWGNNSDGQLGTVTDEFIKVYWDKNGISSTPIKVMENVACASLGYDTSAVITNDGSLYTWGCGRYGRLGNGDDDNSIEPIKIMDNAVSVSLGFEAGAVITNDSSLFVWGYNLYGLGNGDSGPFKSPVKIMDNVKKVKLGGDNGAVITNDDVLYIWGSNIWGQLGNGETTDNMKSPVQVMDKVKDISFGDYYCAILSNSGDIYICGRIVTNKGVIGTASVPTKLEISQQAKEISCCGNTIYFIGEDNCLYEMVKHNSPVKIMENVNCISSNVAITNDGCMYTWGSNEYGQLGNGTTEDSEEPIKIMDGVMLKE